jgi:transcriptional regulator with XRE-family HTH domain
MKMKITLKACRINVGMTLKQASQHFGIHYETLSNYENDSTNVPRTFLIKIESVYGIPVENIFFGKQEDFFTRVQRTLEGGVAMNKN